MVNMGVLFSFSGRIRRMQWWLGSLIAFGILLAAVMLATTVLMAIYGPIGAVESMQTAPGMAVILMGLIMLVIYVGMIWMQLALAVKRLHDRDMSGWWLLLGFIPFANIALFVMLAFLDGTQGPNRFGRSPKGIGGLGDERELRSVFS